MEKEYYTITEFAKEYGCHPDTVRRWIGMGRLKTLARPIPHAIHRIPCTELKRLKESPPELITSTKLKQTETANTKDLQSLEKNEASREKADPILLKTREEHLNEIRSSLEEFKNHIFTPSIEEAEPEYHHPY